VAIFAKLISAIRNKSGDTQVFTEIETQLQQADLGVSLSKYMSKNLGQKRVNQIYNQRKQ